MNKPKYNDSNILICWHHEEILPFAVAFGASAKTLPPASNWISSWSEDVFGWVLQICFDADGKLDTTQTKCISQQLMYDDFGKEPPLSK